MSEEQAKKIIELLEEIKEQNKNRIAIPGYVPYYPYPHIYPNTPQNPSPPYYYSY